MFITTDQYQSDLHPMKAFVALLIPEEGCRVVVADGPEGEVWVDLNPVRHGDGELDLHWGTNCPEAVGLRDIYKHFRRQEKTWWDSGLDVAGCVRQTANKRATRPPSRLPGETVFAGEGMPSQRKLITPRECQRDRFQNKISL